MLLKGEVRLDVFEVVQFLEVAFKAHDQVGEARQVLVGFHVTQAQDLLVVDAHTKIFPVGHPFLPFLRLITITPLTIPIHRTIKLRH